MNCVYLGHWAVFLQPFLSIWHVFPSTSLYPAGATWEPQSRPRYLAWLHPTLLSSLDRKYKQSLLTSSVWAMAGSCFAESSDPALSSHLVCHSLFAFFWTTQISDMLSVWPVAAFSCSSSQRHYASGPNVLLVSWVKARHPSKILPSLYVSAQMLWLLQTPPPSPEVIRS